MDEKTPRPAAGVRANEPVWGSDVIATALREQEIPYVLLNPGFSYRGLHDSLVNFLGNKMPEMLLCLHEEHAVSIAQGYAKVTEKPLAVIMHANIGLMHGTMAIFNAWVGRQPILMLGATGALDAENRRPWIDWIHTAIDQGALIRPYTKWDDQPASAPAAVKAIRRAAMLAKTPPRGPVYVNLDVDIQETELPEWPSFHDIERYAPPSPVAPSAADVAAAAALLKDAKNPVILAGRVSRSEEGWDARIRLAEALNAKVVSAVSDAASFPTSHPLSLGEIAYILPRGGPEGLAEADVVLALEWVDLGGLVDQIWPAGTRQPKVIACSVDHQAHRGWSMDYHDIVPADIRIATTPEPLVDALLAELGAADVPQMKLEKPQVPDASAATDDPIALAELARVFRRETAERNICLIGRTIGWPPNSNPFDHPLDFLGTTDGGGIGGGPGFAVGAALALRDMGSPKVPVAILGDGDFLMGVTALWTAAANDIPLLIVTANNRSFFNDEMHQERIAKVRGRPVENRWIGQRIDGPAPDLAAMAKAQGFDGEGPVTKLADVAPALQRGLDCVANGGRYVVDIIVGPGYVEYSVQDAGD